MLNNIGGYSVDYCKFWIELTPEELAYRMGEWKEIFQFSEGPQGGKVYNVESVKRGERDGSFYFAFDVWGESAQLIDQLDFQAWYPYLDRLDLKLVMPMTVEGQKNYLDYLESKVSDRRNFGWLNSKHRQKRNGRDAGGHGLYIGSHKSDFRCQWTMRGDEDGYQEFQLEDTRLSTPKFATKFYSSDPDLHAAHVGWLPLCKSILTNAQIELSDLDGLYDSDRAAILAGREDIHNIMEKKLDYIEGYLNRLPKDALFGVYRALELKLFGEPPAINVDDFQDAEPNPDYEGGK